MNPFSSRAMIKNPAAFVGRVEQLRTLKNILLTLQSCSLVGPRRIGKSSLLYYLASPAYYKAEYPDVYRFVFLDLQELSSAEPDEFFSTVVARLARVGLGDVPIDQEKDASVNGFRKLLGRMSDADFRLVLCLDEFEMLSQNPRFAPDFFSFLRGLCSNYNLALVTSSRKSLFDICHQGDLQTSQFWNIFVETSVGLMPEHEILRLISEPFFRENSPIGEQDQSAVLTLAGRHPFFAQMACYYLYEAISSGKMTDWALIESQFMAEAKRHYTFVWDQLDATAKHFLCGLLRHPSYAEASHILFQELKRETILRDDIAQPELSSQGWKQFIEQQKCENDIIDSFSDNVPKRPAEEVVYLDFDLMVEKVGKKYRARVLNSPAGQSLVDFNFPFQALELENFFLRIGRPRRTTRKLETQETGAIKEFGARLFAAIFKENLSQCWHSSLDEVNRRGAGLRVRLRLRDVPELMDLPWEYLYNPDANRFLALSAESPVIRFIDLPEAIRPLKISTPVRILIVVSSPKDFVQLDVRQEVEKIRNALRDLVKRKQIEIDFLQHPTQSNLLQKLRYGNYHILHFVGHGGYDARSQDGVLVLEDDATNGYPVSGDRLGMLLHDEKSLRLVVLNACEGARTSSSDPFAGVAQSLVQQGIPAVIAMQFEITDQAAIVFSQSFYTALAEGVPVDASLTEARKAIFADGNDVEWGTPVLYLRAINGKIFDID